MPFSLDFPLRASENKARWRTSYFVKVVWVLQRGTVRAGLAICVFVFHLTAVTDQSIRTKLDLVKCYQFCVTQCRVLRSSNMINEHLCMTYSATAADQGAMQRCSPQISFHRDVTIRLYVK
jgi:hypothetical protein